MPAPRSEFRKSVTFVSVVWGIFTLLFIWCVGHSVWVDLYGSKAPHALEAGRPTVAACTDELEAMDRLLAARMSALEAPHTAQNWDRFESEWDTFTRGFEDRLRRVQARCIDEEPQGTNSSVHDAMISSVDGLDSLRQHMARCGLEGERERESVTSAIARLRAAARANGP